MKTRLLLMNQVPALKECVHRRVVAAGEVIFPAGQAPQMVYQVVRGIVKLVSSSANGREVITELVFPGEVIDFMGCLDGQPSQLSALALQQQEVELLAIPLDRVGSQSELMAQFHANFRTKARFHREMMVAMAVERVEQRAMRALLMLADYLGRPTPHGPSLTFSLTRQEFSELIGTTLETAIRVLSSLRRQGMVTEREGHQMTLNGLGRMEELCLAA